MPSSDWGYTSSDPWGSSWSSSFRSTFSSDPEEVSRSLAPLISHLRKYDRLRARYENQGVQMRGVEEITAHLLKSIKLKTPRGPEVSLSLADQRSMRYAISDVGDYNLRISVRNAKSRMPTYYLCRTRSSYWTDYKLILEDLYMSPDYPILDERFVKLMRNGHEEFHLRLSHLRDGVGRMAEEEEKASAEEIDRSLKYVGEEVFQAAWHEDQRLALAVAQEFEIPQFRQALELLYLCLSGDLCALRNMNSKYLKAFFAKAYPQPAIAQLLKMLHDMDGADLNEVPERALKLYAELSHSFSKLLHIETPWGRTGADLPIYKLVFANTTRMPTLGKALKDLKSVREAADNLDAEAANIISELTATTATPAALA